MPATSKDVQFSLSYLNPRTKPTLFYSGCGDPTVAAPRPDTRAGINIVSACFGRMFKQTPVPNKAFLEGFSEYVQRQLQSITPLSDEDIQPVLDWIETRNRPGSWKRMLKRRYAECDNDIRNLTADEIFEVKMHVKDESYPEPKYPRGIFARQNANKIVFGPLTSAIEKIIYDDPFFIKKIPVKERAKYIRDRLRGFAYNVCSDFSSYEGSFSREFMLICELALFLYMISGLSSELRGYYGDLLVAIYNERRKVSAVGCFMTFIGRRLSGEMWTSLMNGFSNKMQWGYLCELRGVPFVGCVEGDDGIFGFNSFESIPTSKDFEAFGFNCKIEVHTEYKLASFCGIVYDEPSGINICDPRQFLADIAWLPYKYRFFRRSKVLSLVRARVLSYKHQYPGCPIIEMACRKLMAMTSGLCMKWVFEKSGFFNAYDEEVFLSALSDADLRLEVPVSDGARSIMYEAFGILPSVQLELEGFFQNLTSLDFTYPPHLISAVFDEWWTDYAHRFSVICDNGMISAGGEETVTPFLSYLTSWSKNSRVAFG